MGDDIGRGGRDLHGWIVFSNVYFIFRGSFKTLAWFLVYNKYIFFISLY